MIVRTTYNHDVRRTRRSGERYADDSLKRSIAIDWVSAQINH